MIIRAHGEIESKEENNIEVEMPSLTDANDECVLNILLRGVLVVKRALDMHVKVGGLEVQRKNIFHIRCHVQNKVYSLIIDNGNFTLYMCRPIFSCI
jgi:hypothetical protein